MSHKHMKFLNNLTPLNIWATALATPFRHSCDHSLPTHTINYISSVHICLPIQGRAPELPIINEISNKTEIANPSHQQHLLCLIHVHFNNMLPDYLYQQCVQQLLLTRLHFTLPFTKSL